MTWTLFGWTAKLRVHGIHAYHTSASIQAISMTKDKTKGKLFSYKL